MRARACSAVLAVGAAVTCGASARAQEPGYPQRPLVAPEDAFELHLGTGFTQGFGAIAPGQRVADVAGPGVGVDVDGDWRITPHASIGVQVEYEEFANERNTAARGLVANLGVTLHASPLAHGDPWVRLGSGYRLLWSVSPPGEPNTLLHGFEVARLTLGWDARVSPDIALAPVVSGDVDAFMWQVQEDINTAMSSPQIGFFVFAGVQGRFDMGGIPRGTGVADGW